MCLMNASLLLKYVNINIAIYGYRGPEYEYDFIVTVISVIVIYTILIVYMVAIK